MKTQRVLILLGIGILFSTLFLACATDRVVPVTNARGERVNGTATGSAPGFGGEVTVTLTLENGFITNVVARADNDTAMFADPVVTRAHNDMVRFNAPEIDAVSGATITSMAVNAAARDALNQIMAAQ